jgi:AraC-like DNA-binding protein
MNIETLTNLIINKVVSVSNIFSEKKSHGKSENRARWAIVLKHEGETTYKNMGKTLISNNKNLVILPKGSNYEWMCTNSGRFYILEFECQESCQNIFSIPCFSSEKILHVLKDCEYKLHLKNPAYKIDLLKNTYEILSLLLTLVSAKNYQPPRKRLKIEPALEYMARNYRQKITNDFLASLCGISTVYFRKIFTATFGISPITYLQQLKINNAKEMLRSDFGSLTEIAISLGFLDIYDFSRAFKKHVGIPPSEYLKKHKKTND